VTSSDFEARVCALIEQRGPQTGGEIRDALPATHPFEQWRTCRLSPLLATRRVGQRYLRLDEKVAGYARLSPSILREFLTYSVVGLADGLPALEKRTEQLAASIRNISANKLKLASRVLDEVVARITPEEAGADLFAVLVAGDLVFEMAHEAPRPERSTGQMVRGSDLDLVVILDDSVPDSLEQRLDEAIYQQKYRYLINPSLREEIDYTIKRLDRVREQVAFSTLRDMVSCKIVDEATLLYGSQRLFGACKSLLAAQGIPRQLEEMKQLALMSRETTEERLLRASNGTVAEADRNLFCGTEEVEEFD
jgi:hypothetical protein